MTSSHRLDAALQLVDLLQAEVDSLGKEYSETRKAGTTHEPVQGLVLDAMTRLRKARLHVGQLLENLVTVELTEEVL
jgi:hypothetical protein